MPQKIHYFYYIDFPVRKIYYDSVIQQYKADALFFKRKPFFRINRKEKRITLSYFLAKLYLVNISIVYNTNKILLFDFPYIKTYMSMNNLLGNNYAYDDYAYDDYRYSNNLEYDLKYKIY
jgi:hypothetical protein